MILSKRERMIVRVTAAGLAILLADRFFLTPMLDRRARIEAESGDCMLEMAKADALFAKKRRLTPWWRQLTESGLATGAAAAESRLLHSIRDWAQETELNISSMKHERTEAERQFQKLTWRASGTGTMAAISRFLWRIQEASLPIRISDVQIGSRQEGTDSLAIQVAVSTLCTAAKAEREKPAAEREKAPAERERPAAEREKAPAEREKNPTDRDKPPAEREKAPPEKDGKGIAREDQG